MKNYQPNNNLKTQFRQLRPLSLSRGIVAWFCGLISGFFLGSDQASSKGLESSGIITPRLIAGLGFLGALILPQLAQAQCNKTVTANVMAIDQPFFYNRIGAYNASGMIFALEHDVEGTQGNARLKDYKRARPLTLRVNAGDCLAITFTNWLANRAVSNPPAGAAFLAGVQPDDDQPHTRAASIHAMGMPLVGGITSDGSNVGDNGSSLAAPGQTTTYTFAAEREGAYLLYSTGATTGGEGNGGSLAAGLFGVVNVEPPGSVWYRSQVTADDLALATQKDDNGNPKKTADGHPIINYEAVYQEGPRVGLPILKMTQGNEIVHSDLTAIIAGPGGTSLPNSTVNGYNYYQNTEQNPNREEPFREFSIVFHDEIIATQAFPEFYDPVLSFPLHSVRDGFAINYGTGGIGAEILANRKGLGPMKDCTECKYEEFFLTSWVVGDPAMVVDVPANASNPADPERPVATEAFYPDDPSNVYHSYINDHVKFRNVHAGPKEHHIFHLHSHQWNQTPDSPGSTYLDSQAIGPGVGFTYDIAYGGSGNRNKTVGDAIFHCHFYPHFAQGMWAHWRNHDVFEDGTRRLPDAEILAGTPNPALVPLPTKAMAPMPGAAVSIVNGQAVVSPLPVHDKIGNPGYPYFMADAARAGHRPPTPPLDLDEDGGLPRHIITGCAPGTDGSPACFSHTESRLDFDKTLHAVTAVQVPEDGTQLEKVAMDFHTSKRDHASFTPTGAKATFFTNGSGKPQHGAPFADPCVTDQGEPTGKSRIYKAAAIQLDMKFNKAGWHFPQQRMLALWNDVPAFLGGTKPPEPLFFRANTGDCITYYHTNLVPNVYEQDQFQVRTPTDIIGQHIHLVKFDVTASDGSGNGFNYEDGTLSPDEVSERINAIKVGKWTPTLGGPQQLDLNCTSGGPIGTACARTTIQRWYADQTMGQTGDKTLRTVFTHDHYGPSTHQQTGLYSSLVVEPEGSTWKHNETGTALGSREDGGPTSWQAIIKAGNDEHREFLFQFADFQLAYRSDGTPVNPPARDEVPLTNDLQTSTLQTIAETCPGGVPRPCPEAISADDVGTMVVNYRNEPLALRVRDLTNNQQAAGQAGDLSFAFASLNRPNSELNGTDPYQPLTQGVRSGDPYTPLMRVYSGDKVQIRVQVGATEEGHNMNAHGLKWMHQPSWSNSGYRNSQMMGISEHFEALVGAMGAVKGSKPFEDYLYEVGSSSTDLWNGMWGLLRAYRGPANGEGLPVLSNNRNGQPPRADGKQFSGVCPKTAPARHFSVTAILARDALAGRNPAGTVVYNRGASDLLHDPTAILYVRSTDLDGTGLRLKTGIPVEPVILRANAGDCINVTLVNKLPANPIAMPDLPGLFTLPMLVAKTPGDSDFNANQVRPSNQVGLHAQLVEEDMVDSDGANVGFNPVQTAAPGGTTTYKWYAGEVHLNANGTRTAIPMEFGAVNLMPADPIKHPSKGAIGALIIEPPGACPAPVQGAVNPLCGEDATKTVDSRGRTVTTVTSYAAARPGGQFREAVLLVQNSLNLRRGPGGANDPAVPLQVGAEDPEDSGHKAFNYKTEPMWRRKGFAPDAPLTQTRMVDFSDALAGTPQTPVFTAKAGEQLWMRLVHPGGVGRQAVLNVHGHGWDEEPFYKNSERMGWNLNHLSEYKGSEYGIGPSTHLNCIMGSAGGENAIAGDYLYRDQASFGFDGGLWGILRVQQ